MLRDGATEQSVADTFSATKRGVQLFKARHRADLDSLRQALDAKVKDDWIAQTAARVGKLQRIYEAAEAEADEFGFTVVERRIESDGDKEAVIETRDFRAAMVREMRGLLKDAAVEMGQIQQAAPNVTFNDNRQITIVREVHTTIAPVSLG